MLDLRLPSGIFFAITGLILVATGFTEPRAAMTTANVDLYAGLVMIAFAAILLLLALRSRRA